MSDWWMERVADVGDATDDVLEGFDVGDDPDFRSDLSRPLPVPYGNRLGRAATRPSHHLHCEVVQ